MPLVFLDADNFIEMTLISDVAIAATTMEVSVADGAKVSGLDDFHCVIDVEVIKVTNVVSGTLTIEKGQESSSDVAHYIDDTISVAPTFEYIEELQLAIDDLNTAVYYLRGAEDGVVRDESGGYSMLVEETSPTSLSVDIDVGGALIDEGIYRQRAAAVLGPVVAPNSGETRIDIVQVTLNGSASIKTGVADSGVAPDPSSSSIAIAELTIIGGQTTIEAGDISDVRVFV